MFRLHKIAQVAAVNAARRANFSQQARTQLPAALGAQAGSQDFKWAHAAAAMAAGIALSAYITSNNAENCGIVGIVGGPNEDAKEYLLEGLTILQNRGYDSAGIATMTDPSKGNTQIVTTKFASVAGTADSLALLRNSANVHEGNHLGIGHTRWATHGGKTDANAHPHHDMWEQVAVVHNGTITNYNELKQELVADGVKFKSQTDTEVIAQLIGSLMQDGLDVVQATKLACNRLEGTWGVCVMSTKNPNEIVVARNGSPLVLGYGPSQMYIASETTAFNRHTKRFISLKDGEIAVVKKDTAELSTQEDENSSLLQRFPTSRVEQAANVKVRLTPDPYPHWTIREIIEQPKAVAASLGYGGRVSEDKVYLGGLEHNKENMLKINDLLIAACGTSLNAGRYGAKLMQALGSFRTIQTIDAAEANTASLPKEAGGVCVISQSGETKDVHRVLKLAETMSIPTFSVVNAVGSLISRTTKCGVYLNAGRENAVASTKAFVTQVTVLGLIASWFAQNRPGSKSDKALELIQSMQRLPITLGMVLRTREKCAEVAEKLRNSEHMFVLGKGYGESIAHEGALKIKEITYLHAEGYGGGALKHGPFALIEGKEGKFGATPIIMVVLDDEHGPFMKTAAEEVRARGAYTICITDNPQMCEHVADEIIPIPNNGPLTALLAVVPMQLIAYELAVKRGINPDVPRNLAKAVTVD